MTISKQYTTINAAARRWQTNMLIIRRAIAAGELTGYTDKAGTAGDSESAGYVSIAETATWAKNRRQPPAMQETA
jgi:hypothetical protein